MYLEEIGYFLKIDGTWKVIVLGFYHENNDNTIFQNNLLSFIGLSMFKYKMKCRVLKEKMSEQDLDVKNVKTDVLIFPLMYCTD